MMLGNFRLKQSLKQFSSSKKDSELQFSGILGLSEDTVQVPRREGYVYVRVRDNQNEVISAFNDTVSPVFGLPVIIEWQVSRYVVIGRDTERYQLWGTSSPYLPLHGNTHSFSDWGQGGDVTWVYGRQFMPLNAIPSGSSGGQNAIVYPYTYQYDDQWKYLNVTGTPALTSSPPTGASNAKMGLLYLDRRNNILGIDFSTAEFSASITGIASILEYLPQPSSIHYLPIAGVRITTGTSRITWQNLYDVRSHFGGGAGGGGGLIGLTDGSVVFSEDEQAAEDNDNFFYDDTNNALLLRNNSSTLVDTTTFLRALQQSSLGQIIAAVGSSVLSYLGLYRARGTIASPEAVQSGDVLGRIYFNGHDGTGWQSKARWDGKATENWSGAARGSEIEARTTPIGGTDTEKVGSWKGNGLELVKALQTGQLVDATNNYNTDEEDCIVLMDWSGASGTNVDITLHHPTYQSQILYIKRIDDPDFTTVNINAGEGDNIDGESVIYLSSQYESVILLANGTDTWEVLSYSVEVANPNTITENTTNVVAGGTHTHALDITELEVNNAIINNADNSIGLEILGDPGQTEPHIRIKPIDFGNTAYVGVTNHNALFLGHYLTQSLLATSQINSDYPSYIKIIGNGGAVTLTSDPQITNGSFAGQLLLLQGTSNTNTVTLSNGNGLRLKSKVYTLYDQDWLILLWDDDNGIWSEVNRSSPTKEQTWAIQSFHYSGSAGALGESFAMGFYRHAKGASSFNPAKTFGYNLTAHGAKAYIVLGEDAIDAVTIRVSGDQIQSDGTVTASQAEDIVVPATANANDYFQTNHAWVGTLTFTHISGTERPFNYGLVKAWNSFDDVYRVTGLNTTWFSRAADDNIDMRLFHHTASGWVANTGTAGAASNMNIIASLKSDYDTNDKTYQNEYQSWSRNNLSTLVSGSAEGLVLMLRSENQESFLLGNFTLQYRSAW